MNKTVPDDRFIKHGFRLPNAYATMLAKEFGVRTRTLQLSDGHTDTRFECFSLLNKALRVSRTRIRQSEFIEFEVPRGYTLISASRERRPFFCNGVKVNAVHLSLYPGGYEYRGLYPSDWEAFDILINNQFARENEILLPHMMRASQELELQIAEAQGDSMAGLAVLFITALPAVKRCSGDTEVTACPRDLPGLTIGPIEDFEAPGDQPGLLCFGHVASPSS